VEKYCSFHHKTLWIATVFPAWFFYPCFFCVFILFYFFKNYLCWFYFFNIELIENLALYFFKKTLWIATMFSHMIFFMIFFKIIFVDFFLILSWLKIIITIKLNHMGKALLFSSQNTVDCYSISLNGFFYDSF